MTRCVLLLLGLLFLGGESLWAQRWTVSPFAGYRFGGEFRDTTTGAEVSLQENPSYGVEIDIDPWDSGLKFALLYSHQGSDVTILSTTPGMRIDLDVDQVMIGVVQELYDEKFRPFVGGYAGATYLRPSGFDDDLRFGFGFTVGANYYLTKHFGLRVDLRGFGTITDGSGAFLCANGGCLGNWSDKVMWQGELAGSVFVTF